ncbi:hypothetical protein [Halobacteriovorax sp. HLS]|uniref:hypothetical protein n=1 Tax=Halobacteriovorax sp. HLS TaxID=2234000 RepID=UPI000FDADCE4|nr:hypothetical protein [Halobacteriovorax sp. HLS]
MNLLQFSFVDSYRFMSLGEYELVIPRPVSYRGYQKLIFSKISRIKVEKRNNTPSRIIFIGEDGESIIPCHLFVSTDDVNEVIEKLEDIFSGRIESIDQ